MKTMMVPSFENTRRLVDFDKELINPDFLPLEGRRDGLNWLVYNTTIEPLNWDVPDHVWGILRNMPCVLRYAIAENFIEGNLEDWISLPLSCLNSFDQDNQEINDNILVQILFIFNTDRFVTRLFYNDSPVGTFYNLTY